MNEIERKQFKASVYQMRYEELAERAKLRLDRPDVLYKQVMELERAVYSEIMKEKSRPSRFGMLMYRQLSTRIPALLSYVIVQQMERDLD